MTSRGEEIRGTNFPANGKAILRDQASASVEETQAKERPEVSAASGFTDEQLAQLHGMFEAMAPSGRFTRLRGWFRRYRSQAQTFIQDAAPRDEDSDFDQGTFTGRLAAKASKHRGLAALAAVTAIVLIGGLWGVILGGGVALPLAAVIVAAVLGTGLVLMRRGSR